MSYPLLKNVHRLVTLFIATVMVVKASSSADAGLMIYIPDVTVAPGASGSLDVLISGDGADSFNFCFLNFTVSGLAQAANPINFVPSIFDAVTPEPQVSETSPNYVFLGDSLEFDYPIGVDFVTDLGGNPPAYDQITVIDGTSSGNDRNINGNFLLARLNFIAPLSAEPGSFYNIRLDESTSFFEDTSATQLAITTNIGHITISGAAAVPEPGTFALMSLVAAGGLYKRLRKRPDASRS